MTVSRGRGGTGDFSAGVSEHSIQIVEYFASPSPVFISYVNRRRKLMLNEEEENRPHDVRR